MGSFCTDNKFHGSFNRLTESTHHAVLKSSRQKVMKSNKIKMITEEKCFDLLSGNSIK